jgi:hypothetical protein
MSFCSNCGQSLAAVQPGFPSDLPPTIFAGSPNAPQFTPPVQNFSPNAPNFSPQIPNAPQATAAPRKSRTGMWLAILGGLGVLVLLGGGVVLGAIFYLMSANKTDTNSNYNSSPYNSTLVNTTGGNLSNSSAINSVNNPGSAVLSSIQTRKQVGNFSQLVAKYVVPSDYFPQATDAAQAVYQQDAKTVYVTIGKFPSGALAKQNFKTQLNGVKAEKGRISYSNLDKLSFDSATYYYKDYVFYEECNDKGLCTRMHSKDDSVLAEFMGVYK